MTTCDPVLFLLQHVFVAQTGLTRRLAVDLLDKMNNPDNHQHYSEVDDDDLEVTPDPITSDLLVKKCDFFILKKENTDIDTLTNI